MSVNRVFLIGHVGSDVTIRTAGDQKVASFTLATSEKYVTKGTQLYIEGKIKTEKYQKDGQDKFIVRIVANSMQLLGSKPQSHDAPAAQQKVQSTPIPDAGDDEGDDLPF